MVFHKGNSIGGALQHMHPARTKQVGRMLKAAESTKHVADNIEHITLGYRLHYCEDMVDFIGCLYSLETIKCD
jgi:hypothetical protein